MTGPARPTVARVVTRLNVGGPARHVSILTRRLDSFGFTSHLFHGSVEPREGSLVDEDVSMTLVPGLRRSIAGAGELRARAFLRKEFRSRRPSIVHTHMAKAGMHGRLAAGAAGVPLILHTFHGHVLEGYFSPAANRLLVEIERRLARKTDVLIAVSERVRDSLLGLGIGEPDQWRVVPLGLDLEPLLADRMDRARARASLGLPDRGRLVGIVGRLVPIKDLDTFLAAAARVAAAEPDVHFVVAGDGEERARLEDEAIRLLGGRVTFTGWVSDLPALYAALDLTVLTSRNEGTPVALIEAGAAGLSCVATAVGGVAEVVRDGETGLLAAPGDVPAISAAILQLLGDADRAASYGSAARSFVRERFSSDRLVRDIAELYTELLARKLG